MNETMNKTNKGTAEDFISNLTLADIAEIQRYLAEIKLNTEFHDRIQENQRASGGNRHPFYCSRSHLLLLFNILNTQNVTFIISDRTLDLYTSRR